MLPWSQTAQNPQATGNHGSFQCRSEAVNLNSLFPCYQSNDVPSFKRMKVYISFHDTSRGFRTSFLFPLQNCPYQLHTARTSKKPATLQDSQNRNRRSGEAQRSCRVIPTVPSLNAITLPSEMSWIVSSTLLQFLVHSWCSRSSFRSRIFLKGRANGLVSKELRFEHRNHWQSLWAHLTWKHGYPYTTQLIHFVAVYPWIPLSLDPCYRYLL